MKKHFLTILTLFFIVTLFYQVLSAKRVRRVKLYVKDRQTEQLVVQKVIVPNTKTDNEELFWILKELISGPTGNRYEKIFNPDIEVQNVIIRENIAYISFGWTLIESLYDEPSLAIRAIVNSVLANIRGLEGVKILIDGIEPVSTFCDISLRSTFMEPLEG